MANIILAGLVIGQFISEKGFDIICFVGGVLAGASFLSLALFLKKH